MTVPSCAKQKRVASAAALMDVCAVLRSRRHQGVHIGSTRNVLLWTPHYVESLEAGVQAAKPDQAWAWGDDGHRNLRRVVLCAGAAASCGDHRLGLCDSCDNSSVTPQGFLQLPPCKVLEPYMDEPPVMVRGRAVVALEPRLLGDPGVSVALWCRRLRDTRAPPSVTLEGLLGAWVRDAWQSEPHVFMEMTRLFWVAASFGTGSDWDALLATRPAPWGYREKCAGQE